MPGDEVASFVFGLAGLHLGQDLDEFAPGVELLATSYGRTWAFR